MLRQHEMISSETLMGVKGLAAVAFGQKYDEMEFNEQNSSYEVYYPTASSIADNIVVAADANLSTVRGIVLEKLDSGQKQHALSIVFTPESLIVTSTDPVNKHLVSAHNPVGVVELVQGLLNEAIDWHSKDPRIRRMQATIARRANR